LGAALSSISAHSPSRRVPYAKKRYSLPHLAVGKVVIRACIPVACVIPSAARFAIAGATASTLRASVRGQLKTTFYLLRSVVAASGGRMTNVVRCSTTQRALCARHA
jgi:hypothetical protein